MDERGQTDSTDGARPGWNPDPYRRHELRYWDGTTWTDHVSDGGTATLDPVGTAPVTPEPISSVAPAAPVAYEPQGFGAAPATQGMPRWATGGEPGTMARQPPPSPHWVGETRPTGTVDPSLIGKPIGILIPWYKTTPVKVLAAIVGGCVVLFALAATVVFLVGGFSGPDRIDAQPAAATPPGFRLVQNDDYQFAVPAVWTAQTLDQQEIEALAKSVNSVARSGAGDVLKNNTTGIRSVAVDPATGESVTVFPFRPIDGDPGKPDALATIKRTFSESAGGLQVVSVDAKPGNVHGFPAAVLTVNMIVGGSTATAIDTIVQTGDHVYEVTVTSPSLDRAMVLVSQIVPTFEPR